jgi:hypothetical protein
VKVARRPLAGTPLSSKPKRPDDLAASTDPES